MTMRMFGAALLPLALTTATSLAIAAVTAPAARIAAMRTLMGSTGFRAAAAKLDADWDRMVEDVVTLTEIPAPPFQEAPRAKAFAALLKAHGLSDVAIDTEGNATGLSNGSGGALLVVAAHLDTVFPAGTDVMVKRQGNRLAAPGVGDDSSSLAVLLAYLRALDAGAGCGRHQNQTRHSVPRQCRRGRAGRPARRPLPVRQERIQGSHRAVRRARARTRRDRHRRNRIEALQDHLQGPGGHSKADFGMVNPAYAMANAITAFSRMPVPQHPVTVFNVGIVEGGASVNSIPFSTGITVDMRSEGQSELAAEERYLMGNFCPRGRCRK